MEHVRRAERGVGPAITRAHRENVNDEERPVQQTQELAVRNFIIIQSDQKNNYKRAKKPIKEED